MFIRIVATPPGEAPEEVRQAWIGLELPLASGENGPRVLPSCGVLTGSRTILGSLFALLTGRWKRGHGYVVSAPQALALLAEKAPAAALWWRERAPHCWQPGRKFIFAAEACIEVGGSTAGRAPTSARPSSEAIFPAGPQEVTRPREGHVTPDDGWLGERW